MGTPTPRICKFFSHFRELRAHRIRDGAESTVMRVPMIPRVIVFCVCAVVVKGNSEVVSLVESIGTGKTGKTFCVTCASARCACVSVCVCGDVRLESSGSRVKHRVADLQSATFETVVGVENPLWHSTFESG